MRCPLRSAPRLAQHDPPRAHPGPPVSRRHAHAGRAVGAAMNTLTIAQAARRRFARLPLEALRQPRAEQPRVACLTCGCDVQQPSNQAGVCLRCVMETSQ